MFVQATYEELLKTDKIVNCLHNPLGNAFAPFQLATDRQAAAEKYEGFSTDYFAHLMTWGLAAKKHATHRPHVDRTGMGSWIAVEDGAKKWDIAFPPDDLEAAKSKVYSNDAVFKPNFDYSWRWYSFLLSAGSAMCVFLLFLSILFLQFHPDICALASCTV